MKVSLWLSASDGVPFTRRVEAASRRSAEEDARSQGLTVLRSSTRSTDRLRGKSRFDVPVFAEELLALLAAGLSVVEALRALSERADSNSRRVLDPLLKKLSEGHRFGEALDSEGGFAPLFVALVRASEETSDLQTALSRFLAYQRQVNEVRDKIVSSLVYPALLTLAGTGAMLFLLFVVVPRFSGIYEGMHGHLPWTAGLMLGWGQLIKGHGYLVALLSVVTLTSAALVGVLPRTRSLTSNC